MFKLIFICFVLYLISNPATVFARKMVSEHIQGTFKLEKSENFDAFLKEIGVGLLKRQAANLATSTVEVKVDGDDWHIKTVSTFKNSELKFKLGEEFEEERQDGVKVKSSFSLDGDVLTQVQKGGKTDVTITRTFNADGMTLVCETNGVKSTRHYTRVK